MANELTPRAKTLGEVQLRLQKLLDEQASALPKNFNQTRFLQNCLAVLNDTKDIEKCTPMSIARTMVKGAYLDLDFFRRECYAIPYGDQLNFQTDYKGEIKLCHKYSTRTVLDVYAKIVREGDELIIGIKENRQYVTFTPKPFNNNPIVGAFAVVAFVDGGMLYDAMSKEEIEEVRQKYSKAPNSPAWQKSFGEMCKKVVLRRLLKLITLDFDNLEQHRAWEDGGDAKLPPPGRRTIEITAQEVKDPFSDPDAALRLEIKQQHPDEEDWKIEARIKERKEAMAQ